MLITNHPALTVLLWLYLAGVVVAAIMATTRLTTSLAGVRRNPANQRRAMRAQIAAAMLVTCWAWPALLILWAASGRSSESDKSDQRGVVSAGRTSESSPQSPRTRRGAGSGRHC